MSRRWKHAVLVVGLAALVVATVGGAVGTRQASARTDSDQGSKTFRIMGFGPGDEIANVRAEEATAAIKRLGADVDNPRGAFDDQKFLAALAARDVPDIVYLDRKKIATYAARGAFVPLTSCIKNQKVNLKQYRVSALRASTYRGKLYALPDFSTPITIIVNNDVVRQAGLRPSDFDTRNWKKLRAAARKAASVEGGKVVRIGFDPKIPEFFPLWAKSLGHDVLSKNGLRAQLTHPKSIQALEFTMQLIRDQGGWNRFKAFRDTWDFFGTKNQVAENQIGAWPMESWYYAVLARTAPNKAITALPFRNRAGGPVTFLQGSGWAIPRGAKNPGMACTWMRVMTRWQTWLKAAKVRFEAQRRLGRPFTGTFTANKMADVKIFEDLYQSFGKKFYDDAVRLLVQVQRYGFELPASPAGAEFVQAMTDAVNRVLAGQQTPRQALGQAQREAQAAINKARK